MKVIVGALAVGLCLTSGSGFASQMNFTVSVGGGSSPGLLGTNSTQIFYWDNQALYADVFLGCCGNNGPWDTSIGSKAAALDATGAPTVPALTFCTGVYPAATYSLSWTGSGSVSFASGGSCTQTGTTSPAKVVCTAAPAGVGSEGAQPFNQVNATPPVSNIHMINPQATGMFTNDFLDKTGFYSTYRAMDWLNTNFAIDGVSVNPVKNWSDRTNPSRGSRGMTQGGMAYEDLIALANQTGKNIWVNVPVLATDDYVCRLARLMAFGEQRIGDNSACSPSAPPGTQETSPLGAASLLFVEEGNELWNYAFPAAGVVDCWATKGAHGKCPSGGATPTSAILSAEVNTPAWTNFYNNTGGEYGAQSAASIYLGYSNYVIFNQVFSQLGRGSSVKVIVGRQSGNNDWDGELEFINSLHPFSSWAYAFADAP